jgi:hypothetical protein
MHNGQIRNLFSSSNSKLHLPPDWNEIILAGKVGIGPVGVRPFAKSELSP